ncbi:TonB-dependent receptor [Novosphingobium sp. PS1R-30]|uniref:TonB-dependent receptor n=1 Tax=Novosphingobium anseongense TaxID=3133436 RepID=A0ABU8RT22_9SPHN
MIISSRRLVLSASLLALIAGSPAHAEEAESAAAAADAGVDAGTIIVTGTRATGITAADSPAPVQIVGSEQLSRIGQPNLNQALNQLVPSFTAQAFGGDASNLTLTAKLRGLSPNHALVLLDGKRRHPSANLHVTAGPFQGASAPDLDLINPAAIERIEVLTDGAAAQYGSDAIAGVINLILKKDSSGGSLAITAGKHYETGGETIATTGRLALPLGENGFVNATVSYRFHDTTRLGDGDRRVVDINGNLLPGVSLAGYPLTGAANFPKVNPIFSDAKSHLTTALVNAGYDFGGVELYANGTFARRVATANEQYRGPLVVLRPNDGRPIQAGAVVVGSNVYAFPYGFVPLLKATEEDWAVSGGVRGETDGWRWDLSATFGRDRVSLATIDSANFSLFQDFGYTPRDFQDGGFIGSQLTFNLDVAKEFDLGLSKPVNLAFGLERRRDTYTIFAGDPESYYRTGAQSFPGFQPSSAGQSKRKSWAGYLDLTVHPVEAWSVSLAGRYEDYTDIGDTAIGKITTRYDFSDGFALRGTASTGFRAPSLGESAYRAISVSPTSETVQVAANSRAAALLGYSALKPEKSTNFSLGLVARPLPGVTVTLDVYQIKVRDRIASTGTINGLRNFAVVNQAVLDAIASTGREYDKTVPQVGVSTFTNAFDTRTRGVDLVVATTTEASFGKIDWSLNATYGQTKVTGTKLPATAFTPTARSYIEKAAPRYKVGLNALLTSGNFTFSLRETLYGSAYALLSPDGAAFYEGRIGGAAITDVEAAYRPVEWLEFAIGANNLFDKRPPDIPAVPGSAATNPVYINGAQVHNAPLNYAAYGINGGYYYGRVSVKF